MLYLLSRWLLRTCCTLVTAIVARWIISPYTGISWESSETHSYSPSLKNIYSLFDDLIKTNALFKNNLLLSIRCTRTTHNRCYLNKHTYTTTTLTYRIRKIPMPCLHPYCRWQCPVQMVFLQCSKAWGIHHSLPAPMSSCNEHGGCKILKKQNQPQMWCVNNNSSANLMQFSF